MYACLYVLNRANLNTGFLYKFHAFHNSPANAMLRLFAFITSAAYITYNYITYNSHQMIFPRENLVEAIRIIIVLNF